MITHTDAGLVVSTNSGHLGHVRRITLPDEAVVVGYGRCTDENWAYSSELTHRFMDRCGELLPLRTPASAAGWTDTLEEAIQLAIHAETAQFPELCSGEAAFVALSRNRADIIACGDLAGAVQDGRGGMATFPQIVAIPHGGGQPFRAMASHLPMHGKCVVQFSSCFGRRHAPAIGILGDGECMERLIGKFPSDVEFWQAANSGHGFLEAVALLIHDRLRNAEVLTSSKQGVLIFQC